MYVYDASAKLQLISNGSFVGNFNANTGAYSSISDERKKKNITKADPVLQKINDLNVVTYQYTHQRSADETMGFLAQNVEEQFPHLVSKTGVDDPNASEQDQIYSMDYAGMSVVAIKAIQEQQEIIREMREEINQLKNEMEALKN